MNIAIITLGHRALPKRQYTEDGFEPRQVFNIDISRVVTEYNVVNIIANERGQPYTSNGFNSNWQRLMNKALDKGV